MEDVIRVWRCSVCELYVINFNASYLYCEHCGKEMQKFLYKELKQEQENEI